MVDLKPLIAPPRSRADVAEPFGSKQQQNDGENDQKLPDTDTSHECPCRLDQRANIMLGRCYPLRVQPPPQWSWKVTGGCTCLGIKAPSRTYRPGWLRTRPSKVAHSSHARATQWMPGTGNDRMGITQGWSQFRAILYILRECGYGF